MRINRDLLLTQTFFFYYLISRLRNEIGLPKDGFRDNVKEHLKWMQNKAATSTKEGWGHKSGTRRVVEYLASSYRKKRGLLEPIHKVTNKLSSLGVEINETLLVWEVLGIKMDEYPKPEVFMVTSEDNPIEDVGVYVKLTPGLSNERWLELKKEAGKARNTLEKIWGIKPTNKQTSLRPFANKQEVETYLKVEEKYKQLHTQDPTRCSLENCLNFLSKELHISKSNLRAKYYKVQKKYSLPPVTLVQKLSFTKR